jgi:hypothetical protein
MRRIGLVALLGMLEFASGRGQEPPRTGLIVGQVVDATTGKPIPDVIVTLTTPFASSNLPTTPRGRVMTDSDGRFFFAGLPPTPTGSGYAINASKPGYVDSFYGKRRPGGGLVYFDLADGERRNDAKVLMWKYAAIAGTVIDEAGEPVVGVTVRAVSRQFVSAQGRAIGVPSAVDSRRPQTIAACTGSPRLSLVTTWSLFHHPKRPSRQACSPRHSRAQAAHRPCSMRCSPRVRN